MIFFLCLEGHNCEKKIDAPLNEDAVADVQESANLDTPVLFRGRLLVALDNKTCAASASLPQGRATLVSANPRVTSDLHNNISEVSRRGQDLMVGAVIGLHYPAVSQMDLLKHRLSSNTRFPARCSVSFSQVFVHTTCGQVSW